MWRDSHSAKETRQQGERGWTKFESGGRAGEGGVRVIGGLHKIGAVGKWSTLKAVVTRKQSTPNFPKN